MPVSTRHSAAAAPANAGGQQQSKLNFGAKKPTTSPAHLKAKQNLDSKPAATAPVKPHDTEEEPEAPKVADVVIDDDVEEPAVEEAEVKDDDDAAEQDAEDLSFQEEVIERPKVDFSIVSKECTDEAYDITSEQISQYYKKIKNARIAPPVHQEGLTEYEKILRHFDLSSQYGPCVGSVTRLQRWSRAHRFNLDPPIEVLAVLLKSELGENVEPPADKKWKPAPAAAREGVGATAYVNKLLDTQPE
ncbi:hypothetical protein TWF696_002179 [Orbilia brochopaga]|uniref:DNA polymerase delta subunit 4 n=1 Tax=Orbilia brochopaga TaxID=3140254 RepID=A0AAV9U3N1_9PEZI